MAQSFFSKWLSKLISRLSARAFAVLVLALALPLASASAYTLVMRNGRRIEIPDQFFVTGMTLTYEAAAGINVTLQLAHIDISATERFNREPPGNLLKRTGTTTPGEFKMGTTATRGRATKTLNNRDLEAIRQARLKSEEAFERRRRELGLPASTAESSQSAVKENAALRAAGLAYAAEQERAEDYWRERAAILRTDSSALDAEIDYLRARLAESAPQYFGLTPGIIVIQPLFFGGVSRRSALPAPYPAGGHDYSNRTGPPVAGGLSVGGATRGQVGFERELVGRTLGRRAVSRSASAASGVVSLVAPFNYATANRRLLLDHLYSLEAARFGLDERWRALEEEARRAGALPGWLRP